MAAERRGNVESDGGRRGVITVMKSLQQIYTCLVPGERVSVCRKRFKLLLGAMTRFIVPYILELTGSNI